MTVLRLLKDLEEIIYFISVSRRPELNEHDKKCLCKFFGSISDEFKRCRETTPDEYINIDEILFDEVYKNIFEFVKDLKGDEKNV